jgi:hypothetical protein
VVSHVAKGKYQKWLTPDGRTLLEAWARDGLTDEQLSHNMGISVATLYNWKRDHLEILEALKKGKNVVDIEVENALLKRAKGFEWTETKIEQSPKDGRKVTLIKRFVPPDVGAAAFWLKNRCADKWRDKVDPSAAGPQEAQDDGFLTALEQKAPEVWPSDELEPEVGVPDDKE